LLLGPELFESLHAKGVPGSDQVRAQMRKCTSRFGLLEPMGGNGLAVS
jgi:hypothetical protein